MVHSAKAMQKMVAMAQKLGQSEPQHAKLASENTKLQHTIIRLERERDQACGMVDELKGKLDGAEDSLHQNLTELELSKNEAKASYQQGYNEGINVATESYKTQMPVIQDQIWVAAWTACLTKARTTKASPLWTENDLTSIMAAQNKEIAEEEDSLDKELDANVSEQHGVDADQNVEGTNPGQKEASGGPTDGSTVVEDTPAQTSHPLVLTVDKQKPKYYRTWLSCMLTYALHVFAYRE
ncbi:uncharacterized protein LOC131299615 [Rhododendron vialii]|uniref:uncharacterized protein LOC131299615 n=1 Tax=Rhododendron vialii TaxID=182163 RepID=UPI00265E21AD|nr:uncharacterized protein LOC131299615 [Rhododendron vialii]